MMSVGRRRLAGVAGLLAASLLGSGLAYGQAQKPQLSEEAFKNVQVLRGIPVKEFMETMGFFAASLSLNCTDCHGDASASSWANYATDTPLKNTARRMVVMVTAINKANFGGTRSVTCYTCHRGNQRPQVIPSLAAQYSEPPAEDPDLVEPVPGLRATVTPQQILDKYIQAAGGAAALAKVTSFTGKGTYEGFDSDFAKVPVDVYAKAPDMRATVVHMTAGESTTTCDGKEAWASGPVTLVPVPVVPLLGEDLQGARLDALLSFPAQIKQALTDWKGGYPSITIDGKPVDIIEGKLNGTRIKLYFDKQSGLLVRQARYTQTAVGTVVTHVIYSDYRAVGGVKLPYHWELTWVDGQANIYLTSLTPNASVDNTRFNKPNPPPASGN